jgi:hypothetical protein
MKLDTPAHPEIDRNEKVRAVGQAASVLVQDVCAKVYCAERCRGWGCSALSSVAVYGGAFLRVAVCCSGWHSVAVTTESLNTASTTVYCRMLQRIAKRQSGAKRLDGSHGCVL